MEVKLSKDGGETWERTKINFQNELEETGLQVGNLFEWQSEKYEVTSEDGEMQVRKVARRKGK